ncbi:hypothetical protein [Paenibacillus durus]|uniref:Uncharacterized protein n=1 Tax=Paenibacillus durus ATCC 35681 TaxID=1333534 RepID=A0A0F7FBL8_PAEDU|nr:hypothetical protein [Paenibacillus durus]AKG35634.1 hypothetical protein VK70_14490 [Paenibacillus durus ATCC 35681]
MEVNPSSYAFAGVKFLEYTKLKTFKLEIENKLDYFGNEGDFRGYYTKLVEVFGENREKMRVINELFFEHIIYGRLTNIYLFNIETKKISKEIFFKRVSSLIDEFKVNLSSSLYPYLSNKGFYLMDTINVSKEGANFIAGYDCVENDGEISSARLLFGRNVYRRQQNDQVKNEYLLGAVEIDFNKQTFTIYTRNPAGLAPREKNISEKENEGKEEYSVYKYHSYLKEKVSSLLGIKIIKPSTIDDQKGMYKLCADLFDRLVEEPRKMVFENTNDLVQKKVKQLIRKISELGNKPTRNETENLEKKLQALLLGVYISTNMDASDLRTKARELSLIGYPTKIDYKNSRTNRSSTGTSTAKRPIASSDTLYSLLTDFENTEKLDKWSMSWFFDLKDDEDDDVIQTTIESKKEYLKITLIAGRHHNKEIIHHVIGNINKYRQT